MESIPNTISYHLAHPEPTADEYIRSRHLDLGAEVIKKRRIYLDQKFWIYCRDAAMGHPQSDDYALLYKKLQDAVRSGKVICPASHIILEETLKQTDISTKNATARVVQELSTGVAVQPFPVLLQAEMLHFFAFASAGVDNCFPIEQMAWTYIGNIYGHMSPVLTGCDQHVAQAVQKAWYDDMARIDFPVLIAEYSTMGQDLLAALSSGDCERMNEECQKHQHDYSSFKQIFMIEVAGVLDAHRGELAAAVKYMYEKHTGGTSASDSGNDNPMVGQRLAGLIYQAFMHNRISTQLAGLRIMAGIHAAMRHKGQKFRPGDRFDQLHARVALPYCDAFLTERSLGHLLSCSPLNYDQLYGCRIAWDAAGSLSIVDDLTAAKV